MSRGFTTRRCFSLNDTLLKTLFQIYLFVGQHLMDSRPSPRPVEIGAVTFGVQDLRDLALGPPLIHEHPVHALDDQLFLLGAGDQNHAVAL